MKGNTGKSYTKYLVALIIAGFVIYKIWQFASKPDALEQVLEFLGAVVLCFGLFVLLIVVSSVLFSLENKSENRPLPKAVDFHYSVDATRTKPTVDTREGYALIAFGVMYLIFALGFCYMFVAGLIDEFGGIRTIGDIDLIEICSGLFGVLFMLATGAGTIYMIVEGKRTFSQNRDWMRGAIKTRAAIIDRDRDQIITADDYKYGGYTMYYALILQFGDQPGVPELDRRIIRANVSKRIFNRYAWKASVTIYHARRFPLTFILRGE